MDTIEKLVKDCNDLNEFAKGFIIEYAPNDGIMNFDGLEEDYFQSVESAFIYNYHQKLVYTEYIDDCDSIYQTDKSFYDDCINSMVDRGYHSYAIIVAYLQNLISAVLYEYCNENDISTDGDINVADLIKDFTAELY